MTNPFSNRAVALNGPAKDIVAITPSDTTDLATAAIALYVETGGTITADTVNKQTRTFSVGDFSIMPIGVLRVHATGTTALGIHALTLS